MIQVGVQLLVVVLSLLLTKLSQTINAQLVTNIIVLYANVSSMMVLHVKSIKKLQI
jgi:hypothetical protein